MFTQEFVVSPLTEFAQEIRQGLCKPQKELPSKYLYDEIGSLLFDAISLLPEYGLTRAEERLLRLHAPEIVAQLPPPVIVAELGSGTGKKTRWILEALAKRQPVYYFPIEISPTALALCEQHLRDLESISIVGFEREYLDGLVEVAAQRKPGQHLMVLFLGSTIGNFDRSAGREFLSRVRQILQAGDSLLLGADLEKSIPELLEAYDDALGITAAFNLNLLSRINQELEGDFILPEFQHVARYDVKERRVEMHLRAGSDQNVKIGKLDLSITIEQGETIWTESSHRYTLEELVNMAEATSFRAQAQWVDSKWAFADNLWIAA